MARTKKSKPGSASRKRKRSSDGATPSNSDQSMSKKVQIDDDLKNLLTGADVPTEPTTTTTPSESKSPASDNAAKDPSYTGDTNNSGSTITSNGDVNNEAIDKKPSSSSTQPSPIVPISSATPTQQQNPSWMAPLLDAHANKISVTVILDRANLETTKASGRSKNAGLALLNCDDHRNTLQKTNRDANDARPDITHQCLLALQDSPLNKAGKLKVYVSTAKNVLIDIHPQTRIPRTYKRFAGLMTELLDKLKIRGTTGSKPLLKVIRNPITAHLPVGAHKIVCTYNSENVVDMREHAMKMAQMSFGSDEGVREKMLKKKKEVEEEEEEWIKENGEEVHVVYVVGAMAHGKITQDWADEYICISEYPLSAATVCSRLLYSYESLLGIM